MSTQAESPVIDSVNAPMHPFGFPLGTIRGIMSLVICGFFWLVLLWPDPQPVRPLLAHFFMLALVLLVFSPHSKGASDGGSSFVPNVIRFAFIAGTLGIVIFAMVQFPERLKTRLTPDTLEFKEWWAPFLATTFGGFAFGLILRKVFGEQSPVFRALRAWFSVVGLLLMGIEMMIWLTMTNVDNKPEDFIHTMQAFELAVIAAYFGTRA